MSKLKVPKPFVDFLLGAIPGRNQNHGGKNPYTLLPYYRRTPFGLPDLAMWLRDPWLVPFYAREVLFTLPFFLLFNYKWIKPAIYEREKKPIQTLFGL